MVTNGYKWLQIPHGSATPTWLLLAGVLLAVEALLEDRHHPLGVFWRQRKHGDINCKFMTGNIIQNSEVWICLIPNSAFCIFCIH